MSDELHISRRTLLSSSLAGAAVGVGGLYAPAVRAQADTFRLAHTFKPGSLGAVAADSFVEKVATATEGRVRIDVYPAGQLGDWTEAYEQIVAGAIDMGVQGISTAYDSRLAIAWFPYTVSSVESAQEAFTADGYIAKIVDGIVQGQNLHLLGVVGLGMGGAGFIKEVNDPTNPDATHDIKIRVWPGGLTHQKLMERLGYNVATVPWAELYTAMQSGVVDGHVGGTPELALTNFGDITRLWIQFNDHFEPGWIITNQDSFARISSEDQAAVRQAAQEATKDSFVALAAADQKAMDELKARGAEIVTLDDAQLEAFATICRKEVWPEIAGEIGDETMAILNAQFGLG